LSVRDRSDDARQSPIRACSSCRCDPVADDPSLLQDWNYGERTGCGHCQSGAEELRGHSQCADWTG
jgi:hypothetical protein